MLLRNIPRGEIEKAIETAARGLKSDPGSGYKGDCEMFRGETGLPVCRGVCKGTKGKCHMLRIEAAEGPHSDIYNILVICTCKTLEELQREFETDGRHGG